MSSKKLAIRVENLAKCHQIYHHPRDRLKQMVLPRLQCALGKKPQRYFREYWALRDVSFEVNKGEVVGIIGCNGAGKSTLLQIICGTLSPSCGSVAVYGRVAALLELGAGFNVEFTGRENVFMYGLLLGLSKREIDACFDAIVTFADIGDVLEQPVKTYSTGMLVRLAFAVATCVDPDILVVDEALAVGDAKFQAKCFRRFDTLLSNGTTILFVTHSTEQIVRHCQWAVLLDKGRVVQKGEPKAVVNTYFDLLFGVGRKEVEQPSTVVVEPSIKACSVPRLHGRFEERSNYNSDEYRWGNREAEIVDYLVTFDGVKNETILNEVDTFCVSMVVRFHRVVDLPVYGITIKTPDGITVYGANSRDVRQTVAVRAVKSGEIIQVNFFVHQRLGAGDYLLSLGVVEAKESGDIVPLDRRYDSGHIHVVGTGTFFGLVDLSMKVEVV